MFEDYFYRAAIKYDLYLGHPFLTKNKVAPVGHRRCFILESGEQKAPSFRFLHSGYRNAKEFLSRRVNTVFGEDGGISGINATTAYSILLQERRRDTQRPKPRNWKSSYYRVVDKLRDYICSYFLENHDFVPAKDAFCNELNRPFKRLADDAWAVKSDKRLWINPPFHLLGEVVQKIKEDRTEGHPCRTTMGIETMVEGCFGHDSRLHPPPPRRQAVHQGRHWSPATAAVAFRRFSGRWSSHL